jgi:ubiquinone biosynthesis protein Coq4
MNYNPEQLRRNQLLQSLINTYGMMYLDQLSEEEFEELMEEEEHRYFE